TYQDVGALDWESLVPNSAPGFLFAEHRLIKAVSLALDRQEILDKGPTQGVGVVGYGPISPAHFAYDASFKPYPKQDIDAAKKLVADLMKQQRAESDPAKRKPLLQQAQQIYVVEDPARVWYQHGVSPIVTVKNFMGLEPYPDRIPRFQAGYLQK